MLRNEKLRIQNICIFWQWNHRLGVYMHTLLQIVLIILSTYLIYLVTKHRYRGCCHWASTLKIFLIPFCLSVGPFVFRYCVSLPVRLSWNTSLILLFSLSNFLQKVRAMYRYKSDWADFMGKLLVLKRLGKTSC